MIHDSKIDFHIYFRILLPFPGSDLSLVESLFGVALDFTVMFRVSLAWPLGVPGCNASRMQCE